MVEIRVDKVNHLLANLWVGGGGDNILLKISGLYS